MATKEHVQDRDSNQIVMGVVIIMMTKGLAKDDLESIVKDMQMEMHAVKECFALNEEKLMRTQRELLELNTENVQLKEDLTKEEMSFLKEPPICHLCGYQSSTTITEADYPI